MNRGEIDALENLIKIGAMQSIGAKPLQQIIDYVRRLEKLREASEPFKNIINSQNIDKFNWFDESAFSEFVYAIEGSRRDET